MSRIMTLIGRLKAALKTSWQDYPEALFFAYLFGLIAIIRIHRESEYILGLPAENVYYSILTAVPLFLVVVALCKRFGWPTKIRIIGDVVALLLIVIGCFSLSAELTTAELFRIFVHNVSLYLLFSLIPFYKKDEKYDLGVIKLIARGAITLLYSLVLIIGSFAILSTIDYLLDVSIDYEIYLDIFVLVFCIFAPTFLLGEIPDRQSVQNLQVDQLIQKLHLYVIMPLLCIYSAILYAYFAKILFVWQLPQNMIVNLTLWYGIIVVLTLFFTRSYRNKFAIGRWFHKWMPRILILPAIMMVFALYLRISQYGLTVKRYFVLVLVLWLIGVIIYFVIRLKRSFQYIVIAAVLIMIISLDAPINAFTISFNSQYNRLKSILQRNDMLVNGKLIANADVDAAEQEQICDLIDYFIDQEQVDQISFLPADFNEYDDMNALFGFEYQGYHHYRDETEYLTRHYYGSVIDKPISGYNSFFSVELPDDDNNQILQIDDDYNLVVNRAGMPQVAVPLKALLLEMKQNQDEWTSDKPLIVEQSPDYYFIISSIYVIYNPKDETFEIDTLSGYLFVK